MTASDLKSLPIFDNDYASAMGAFLDSNVSDTGGTGLMVDGVEANRATVSASAVRRSASTRTPIRRNTTGRAAGRWRSSPSPRPTIITASSIFSFATRR